MFKINKSFENSITRYSFKMYTDEQMKRLAQQEYNNMLEELQEDDNVDDDGEISNIIFNRIQLISFLFIRIFLNKN